MMNRFYNYEHFELWNGDNWKDKISPINGLIQWVTNNTEYGNTIEFNHREVADPLNDSDYRPKTSSIEDTATLNAWADRGVYIRALNQGTRWVAMLPKWYYDNRYNTDRLRTLVIVHREDYKDPWWFMRTVEYYKDFLEEIEKRKDFMVICLVIDEPDVNRTYLNVMQEAFCLYPADIDNIYVDIRPVVAKGKKMAEIEDFRYYDLDGNPANPDEYIEKFPVHDIPVINISGRWDNGDSLERWLVTRDEVPASVNKEWVMRTMTGKKMMEGIYFEYIYSNLYQPGLKEHFENMGLKFEICEYKGERWAYMIPRGALENPDQKLPVVVCFQEMYRGNEHLAVAALSYFYEYCEIAAQGECALVFFAMEDPCGNDMIVDILKEFEAEYPLLDPTRVYITGHSHDGGFTRMLGYKFPKVFAATALLGNGVGLASYAEAGDPVRSTEDADAERYASYEIPAIILGGESEFQYHADDPVWIKKYLSAYKRRLVAGNCPMKTDEEILAAKQSPNKAIRMLGAPVDKTDILWMEGYEHYIGDVINNDGKNWLRYVRIENMPHTTSPSMLSLSWSFMRRFAKDNETGKITELY